MSIFANTIDGNDIYAKRAEQDKDGNPIRSVPSPGDNEHRGEVLTVNNSDEVVWAPASGGGGGDPFADMASWVSTFNGATLAEYLADPDNPSHLDYKELEVNVKVDNGVIKRQYCLPAGSASFEGPWAS